MASSFISLDLLKLFTNEVLDFTGVSAPPHATTEMGLTQAWAA